MKKYFLYFIIVLFLLLTCKPSSISLPAYILEQQGMRKKLIHIPSGEFFMGSSRFRLDEKPVHKVKLTDFYMDETPVTYKEYAMLIPVGFKILPYWHYSSYNKKENPVTGIRWYEAAQVCNYRSRLLGLEEVYVFTGKYDKWSYPVFTVRKNAKGYHLPTEAQFEYAAAGRKALKQNVWSSAKLYPWGNTFISSYANYDTGRGTKQGKWWRLSFVKEQYKNDFSLYNMSGNIWQWMEDYYIPDYYKSSPKENPAGPSTGSVKSLRGGSWGSPSAEALRISRRSFSAAGNYNFDIGFRCVLPADALVYLLKGREGKNIVKALSFPGVIPSKKVQSIQKKLSVKLYYKKMKHLDNKSQQKLARFSDEFIKRLADYIHDFFPESLYFQQSVDRQEKTSPQKLAQLITEVCLKHKVNPLFLLGIMKAESGFGTVSFPRWFNNPMAYHWANAKMKNGVPQYYPKPGRNRKYKDLRTAFSNFARGIRRKIYYRKAEKNFYGFHKLYVGYEALEWMKTVSGVYYDISGIVFTKDKPELNSGKFIYSDWDEIKKNL